MRLFRFLCAVGTGLALFGSQARCHAQVAWPAYPIWPQAGAYGYYQLYPYRVQPTVPVYPVAWAGQYQVPYQRYPVASSWPSRGCTNCAPYYVVPAAPCPAATLPPAASEPKATASPTPDQVAQLPQPVEQAPVTEVFVEAPEGKTKPRAPFNPQMIGDLGFGAAVLTGSATPSVLVPLVSRGAFKVAENESPRPLDRFFVTYNYYNKVFDQINGDFIGQQNDLHREVFGFEKTFLNGRASIGARVPFAQFIADAPLGLKDINDLSFLLKIAAINDPATGNVLSGGIVVTVPTGPTITLFDGSELESTLLQPWVGYIWNKSRFYVHGFTSCTLPTDSEKDVILLFNDFGAGYRLYQGTGCITGLIPVAEVHVTTPLNHRGFDPAGLPTLDPVRAVDLVAVTGGMHVEMGRCLFTFAAAAPVTGPRPYTVEGIAQFNVRW